MSLASHDQHCGFLVHSPNFGASWLRTVRHRTRLILGLAMAIEGVASIVASRNVCALLTILTTRAAIRPSIIEDTRYLDMIQHRSNHVYWKSMLEVRKRLQTLIVTTHKS